MYTATNTTFTNRTRHEGQLRLGTNLHILENIAAGVTAMVALGDMQRMWDRYDPRSSNDRDRDDVDDRSRGSRGGSGERDHAADRDPRDVFTKDLDLPRGRERRPVRERDRVYEIDGTESRMLAARG